MILGWFAFGVQQIIETDENCVTTIIVDNGSRLIYPPKPSVHHVAAQADLPAVM